MSHPGHDVYFEELCCLRKAGVTPEGDECLYEEELESWYNGDDSMVYRLEGSFHGGAVRGLMT